MMEQLIKFNMILAINIGRLVRSDTLPGAGCTLRLQKIRECNFRAISVNDLLPLKGWEYPVLHER